jgi:hypothetical protein
MISIDPSIDTQAGRENLPGVPGRQRFFLETDMAAAAAVVPA